MDTADPQPHEQPQAIGEPATEHEAPVTVIEPPKGWIAINWRELWDYRELLWFFTLRNVKGKMKQTAFGPLWIVLPPMIGAGIFTMLFGVIAGLPSGDIPYPIFAFTGMLVWRLFAGSLGATSNCLIGNAGIFTKVYIPRLIMPIAGTIAGLVEFAIQLAVLIVVLTLYGVTPSWRWLMFPAYLAMAMLVGTAVGLWLSALGVKYRDVRMVGTLVLPFWMWLTPVAYSSQAVAEAPGIPDHIRPWVEFLFQMNPMYMVVEGFRWCVLGQSIGGPEPVLLIPLVGTFLLFILGLYYFRRVEANFADVV